MKKLVTILSITVLVALTGCSTQEDVKPKAEQEPVKEEVVVKEPEYDWSKRELVKNVPLPDTDSTSIEEDRDDLFWVYINGNSEDFKSYVEKCKVSGFNIDIREMDDAAYSAYNEDGVQVDINLNGTQYELVVKESKIKDDIVWSTTGMSNLIPKPDSTVGSIEVDSSNQFTAYVGKMSADEFRDYMEKCIANGFEYDYMKGDTYFDGRNKNGDHIHLSYGGVNTMYISLMSMELIDDGWTPPAE